MMAQLLGRGLRQASAQANAIQLLVQSGTSQGLALKYSAVGASLLRFHARHTLADCAHQGLLNRLRPIIAEGAAARQSLLLCRPMLLQASPLSRPIMAKIRALHTTPTKNSYEPPGCWWCPVVSWLVVAYALAHLAVQVALWRRLSAETPALAPGITPSSPEAALALENAAEKGVAAEVEDANVPKIPSFLLRKTLSNVPSSHREGPTVSVAVSTDGSTAVSASRDGWLRIWDLKSSNIRHVVKGDGLTVRDTVVSLTPDGSIAVAGGSDKVIRVLDARSGVLLKTLRGHTGAVTSVAVTADGRAAVTASKDCTLRMWDLSTGAQLRVFQGHEEKITGMALTHDGKTALTSSIDGLVKVWDVQQGLLQRQITVNNDFYGSVVAVAADGRTGVVGRGKVVEVLNLANVVEDATRFGQDASSGIWGSTARKATPAPPSVLKGHTSRVIGVAMDSSATIALSVAADDSTIWVWDLKNRTLRQAIQGHTDDVVSIAVTPDGLTAVSASADNTLKVWTALAAK